jgi:hypothetical protein
MNNIIRGRAFKMPQGFTSLCCTIADDRPKALGVISLLTDRPECLDLSEIARKRAIKDLKSMRVHWFETVGGLVAFIKPVIVNGEKQYKQYLVGTMRQVDETADLNKDAFIARLTRHYWPAYHRCAA